MAKKTSKKAKIINSEKELPVDVVVEKGQEVWAAKTVEAHSDTKLKDDKGEGTPVTIRSFDFAANPEAFREKIPTAQELFNSHLKLIESMLWKDGWAIDPLVPPRLLLSRDKTHYRIFVTAKPAKGYTFKEQPKTLAEIANVPAKNFN